MMETQPLPLLAKRRLTVTDNPANTLRLRKRGKLWLAFSLAVSSTAGAAYIALHQEDWKEYLVPSPQAPIKPVPAQQPVQAVDPALIAPSFDAVSADEKGMVVAAGKAQPDAAILLQNGAQTLGQSRADDNGEWVLMPERPLAPGYYNLSLLSVHPKTHARVPSLHTYALTIAPLDKPAPAQTASAAAPPKANSQPAAAPAPASTTEPGAKTAGSVAAVKHGDTLWAMAQRYYGKGIRYNEIAGANKDRIKNPNLIYPKQQLTIPGGKSP